MTAGRRLGTSDISPSFRLRSTRKMTKEMNTNASDVPCSIEGTSRAEIMFRMAETEFARARQIDAQQDTPGRLERFTLIEARD